MLRLLFPYLLFGTLGLIVLFDNVGSRDAGLESGAIREVVSRDLVCQMDVGDRITADFEGRRYHFCTENCRELFLAQPGQYLIENCLVCLADEDQRKAVTAEDPAYTWQGDTYHFCVDEHRAAFAADPAGYFIHSMWGIPDWLYGSSIALVLVLSFGLFELFARYGRNRPDSAPRIDLLRPAVV
ncbi:MAG: YHS domain-containing protein, partial [Planctomycetota bacterium]